MNELAENILKDIPKILNANGSPDVVMQMVLDEIKKGCNISKAAIYYLSDNKAFLKKTDDLNYFEDFCIDESELEILEHDSCLEVKEEDITVNGENLYVNLFPLKIQSVIFGFLCTADAKQMDEPKKSAINSLSSVVSYSLKDVELASVYKNQLKMMQSGIIDKTQAVKEIKEENARILEADKLKNEFIANVSHELRTPLNAIIGLSEVLISKIFGELNDKQCEYVNDIYASGVHLLGMINEILDISKIEANAMKLLYTEFEPETVIQEVVRVMKPLADKKQIEIKVMEDKVGTVRLDAQKLHQILYNLIGNAIKFTPEKGLIQINAIMENNSFILSVEDNGIGIPKDKLENIFEKFFQVENPYTKTGSSTGLGLTITKKLVEMQNGKISVSSELSKGTKFVLMFEEK